MGVVADCDVSNMAVSMTNVILYISIGLSFMSMYDQQQELNIWHGEMRGTQQYFLANKKLDFKLIDSL